MLLLLFRSDTPGATAPYLPNGLALTSILVSDRTQTTVVTSGRTATVAIGGGTSTVAIDDGQRKAVVL